MDKEIRRHYTLLVDFLGHILGPDYEVALHELTEDSNQIIAISNGELTGRHLGSPLSNKMLEFLSGRLYETQDYVLSFESTSVTGKKMHSNSMFIKDRTGSVVGLLCINFDSSRYEALSKPVQRGTHPQRAQRHQPHRGSERPLGIRPGAGLPHLHRRSHCQHRVLGGGQLSGGCGPAQSGRENGDHGDFGPQGRVFTEGLRELRGQGAAQLGGQHLPLSGKAEQPQREVTGFPFTINNSAQRAGLNLARCAFLRQYGLPQPVTGFLQGVRCKREQAMVDFSRGKFWFCCIYHCGFCIFLYNMG